MKLDHRLEARRWLGLCIAVGLGVAGCGSAAASAGKGQIVAVGAENEYANVISQIGGRYVAASAIETAFVKLRDQGDGEPADMAMFDFKEFCGLIGFQEVWDFEKKWAR